MNPVLAQAAPGDRPVIDFPTPDWSSLMPQLFGFMTDAAGHWLQGAMHKTFDGLWNGDHNVIASTPLDLTWNLGPIHAQVGDVQTAARAILVFALILLGLRGILSSVVPQQPHMLAEFINGLVGAIILLAAFPLLVPMAIGAVNAAAGGIANGAFMQGFVAAGGSAPDPMVGGILFVILLYFGVRLLIKCAWRIMFLAVLLPVGVLACALYAIPETRWILSWWARAWGGMLLAQIPSVLALSIALGSFVGGGGGIGSFVWSIAAMQLATELYSIIPFGNSGERGGSPFAAALGGLRAGTFLGGMIGGGPAAAALSRTEARFPMQGHMESTAAVYGYQ